MTPKIVFSVYDVADILNISDYHAYNLFKEADFPSIKIGRRHYVRMDRFFSWMQKKTVTEVENASKKKNKPSKAIGRSDD